MKLLTTCFSFNSYSLSFKVLFNSAIVTDESISEPSVKEEFHLITLEDARHERSDFSELLYFLILSFSTYFL